MCGLLFVVFILNAFTKEAHAGLLSFLENFFGGGKEEVPYNSQNVPLLNAPQALDLNGTGGPQINYVDGSALMPVVGPLGSVAESDLYKLDQITTYTVRGGDNLSKIADMFGINVNTIYWANNLKKGALIKTGDVLVILPISGIQYEVKKGDTVKSLAKKFKSDAEEIMTFNGLLQDGFLEVGSTIIIPDAEIEIPSAPPKSSGTKNVYRGGGGPEIIGYYIRPILAGRKTQGIHGFNGVDLADSCGTQIFASAAGTVLIARSTGWNGGYGKYIVIIHPNGTQTLYSHMSSVYVVPGQIVSQGAVVGAIGSTGNSSGCHVHFEVRGAKNPF